MKIHNVAKFVNKCKYTFYSVFSHLCICPTTSVDMFCNVLIDEIGAVILELLYYSDLTHICTFDSIM